MGSKHWCTLSVLAALCAFSFGCNNGPQKDTTLGATNGFPPVGQSAQTAPQGGLPKFPLKNTNTFADPQKPQLPPIGQAPNQTGQPTAGPNFPVSGPGATPPNFAPINPASKSTLVPQQVQPPANPFGQQPAPQATPFGQPPPPPANFNVPQGGFGSDRPAPLNIPQPR